MSEQDLRELFRSLKEIYKLQPEVAQRLLKQILEILHGADGLTPVETEGA